MKLRIHNTQIDNLVANLRGEVGEIIFTWILMRKTLAQANQMRSSDPALDMKNADLCVLDILVDKLRDEIVARLSGLAEPKIGRLTFHFAQEKLARFQNEVQEYRAYIETNRFREKRNSDISHKELPEKWSDHKYIYVPYRIILKALARALRIMKRIDRMVLGPSAPYLWWEMRKRRYQPTAPIKVGYMLMPYLWLAERDRSKIILQEMKERKDVWIDMETTVNGVEVTVKACRQWGGLLLGDRMLVLSNYPLQQLKSITTSPSSPDADEPRKQQPNAMDAQTTDPGTNQ